MAEIEKMFENANIKKIHKYQREIDNGDPRFTGIGHSDSYIVYPDFTAEKQLKIIKWFISNSWWLNLKSLDKKLDFSLDFDEKLAKLVNRLWESFDDQEKEEIRGILNER